MNIELVFDESQGHLNARMIASSERMDWTIDSLMYLISEAGFSDLYFHEEQTGLIISDLEKQTEKGRRLLEEMLKKQREKAARQKPATVEAKADPSGQDVDIKSAEKKSVEEKSAEEKSAEISISPDIIFNILGIEDNVYFLAERKDALIFLDVSDDEMEVGLMIQPAFGGQLADKKQILNALKEKEVSFGVIDAAVDAAVLLAEKNQPVNRMIIAKGRKPRKGKDSEFEKLVEEHIQTGPSIDDKGVANYRDTQEFVIVEAGTPLMRRLKPKPGKNGVNVFGQMVPSEPGEVLPFSGNIEGAVTSSKDPDLLVANLKGHPLVFDRGVSVDPTLVLKGVNLASGNIDFDGSLWVKGDVEDGMEIKVTGDVTVDGVVGKATIHAKGSVAIGQGLIGGIKNENDRGADTYGAHIESGHSVSARFAACAKIRARKTIMLIEYASHCDLYADEKVLVGPQTGKGTLIGGVTRAFDLVVVKRLGSPGSVPTVVRVGAEADTLQNFYAVANELKVKQDSITQLNETLLRINQRIRQKGLDKDEQQRLDKANAMHKQLQTDINRLSKKEKKYKLLLVQSKKSRVIVKHQVFQNAEVHILGSRLKSNEDKSGGTYRFDVRKVCFER